MRGPPLRSAAALLAEFVHDRRLGWERANRFAENGEVAEDRYTYQRPNWFGAVSREHREARPPFDPAGLRVRA